MAINPRELRPSELCRLLNSTPLGEVINERQLHRHRTRAGLRIGDGRRVDLLRYVVWLLLLRHAVKPQPDGDPYEKLKESARARNAALALAGRDIGELPDVVNPDRKARAARNFRFFCESYFPLTFHLPWSPDHLKVIAKIEQAVLRGGLFAMAMPRGSGKTTLCECACIWAELYGHREFVCLIGSDEGHATDMLESIKTELEGNELLLEDFPEVVFPIQCLDGIANRCSGQLYKGQRTHIGWTAREIVLPTMPGSAASGAIIRVAGITGRVRGMKFKRPDGRTVRPSLVVTDDPQTDESARSLSQCQTRESILAGAILGLAGPAKKISGILPCTVIRPGDMADNILDRDKHPEWNGERTKMVYSFPTDDKLWQRYTVLRAESLRLYGDIRTPTASYAETPKAMHAGAEIAWPERFNHDEISAVQHAMNLKLQDEAAFWAEYQNEPQAEQIDTQIVTFDDVLAKTNGLPQFRLPVDVTHVVAAIDIQEKALYYLVLGVSDEFVGYIVDYGIFPEQPSLDIPLSKIINTIQRKKPDAAIEGQIYWALDVLVNQVLCPWDYVRDDGTTMRIERLLIDANWGTSRNTVYQFCRMSPFAAVLMPAHGRYVGAKSVPFQDYQPKPGVRAGANWRIPISKNSGDVRHVLFDSNHWKSFVHERFSTAMGERGCYSLYGLSPQPDMGVPAKILRGDYHRGFASHAVSEYRVVTEGRGRKCDEWSLRPERTDNHWLDDLVMASVAASMQGASMTGAEQPRGGRQRKVRKIRGSASGEIIVT